MRFPVREKNVHRLLRRWSNSQDLVPRDEPERLRVPEPQAEPKRVGFQRARARAQTRRSWAIHWWKHP